MVNLHYRTAHPHFKQVLNTLFANAPADAAAKTNAGEWIPRVDIKEENDRFVILADIPGIDPNDIEVNMDKGVLSIKGTRARPRAGSTSRPRRGTPRRRPCSASC